MSFNDNLDSLSNKELRAKCLEYNLPNVPVTDSSRSVLIKRIRNVMHGKATTGTKSPKPTIRRETVHVSNPHTKTKAKENNADTTVTHNGQYTPYKRQTMNYLNSLNVSPITQTTTTDFTRDIGNKAHNEHIVPVAAKKVQSFNSSGNILVTPVISESDADSIDTSHSRRSVSLTKSSVLTTSYNQEKEPQRKRLETYDVENDEEAEEEEYDLDTNSSSEYKYNAFNKPAPVYNYGFTVNKSQHEFAKPKVIENYSYGLPKDHLKRNNESVGYNVNYTQNIATEPNYLNQSTNRLHGSVLNSTSYDNRSNSMSPPKSQYGFTTTTTSPRTENFSGTKVNSLYPKLPQSPFASNVAGTDYLHSANVETATRKRVRSSLYSQTNYTPDTEDTGNSSDDCVETLSDFPRRSELLVNNSFNKPSTRLDKANISYESPKSRRPINTDDDDSIEENLRQFFQALERKYHLKQSFILIGIFVLAAFIYAFFLH